MADTGCQSSLAGIKVANRLGFTERNLIPVTMKMHAANSRGIKVLGAAILRFSGKGMDGDTTETRQVVYITDNSDKLFISREACVAFGMITEHFLTIGETAGSTQVAANNVKDITMETTEVIDGSSHTECGCPKRETPPPIPTNLPYPTTEEFRADLQQYLLDRYKSSTFNTCEHQSLPLMAGLPMQLMVDSNAIPVAHHTPVPVPLHWQEEVKAGLDQDVSLGVIEPVPVGDQSHGATGW